MKICAVARYLSTFAGSFMHKCREGGIAAIREIETHMEPTSPAKLERRMPVDDPDRVHALSIILIVGVALVLVGIFSLGPLVDWMQTTREDAALSSYSASHGVQTQKIK